MLARTLSIKHHSGIVFQKYDYNVTQAFKRRNWKETDGDDWDVMWAEKEWIHEVMDHIHL